MKGIIVTIIFILVINLNSLSQLKSNYASGFEVGFKEGYCYNNKNVDCFYPLTPEAPLPRINENKDNYTQGYNRGFQFGLDLRRSNDGLNSSNTNLNSQLIQYRDYISQQPAIDAMVAVGMMKQRKYDLRKGWIQDRINNLSEILIVLFNKETLPSGADVNKIKSAYWQTTTDYVNKLSAVDFADDYQFNSIQSNFNKIEKYYYESYSYLIQNSNKTKVQETNSTQISIETIKSIFGDWASTKPIKLGEITLMGFSIPRPENEFKFNTWYNEGLMYDHKQDGAMVYPSSYAYLITNEAFKFEINFSAAGLDEGQIFEFKFKIINENYLELEYGNQKTIYSRE
jgi:hypothetical protein